MHDGKRELSEPAATVRIAVGRARTAARQWHPDEIWEFTVNSHLGGWFGLRIRRAFWDHDPITTVLALRVV